MRLLLDTHAFLWWDSAPEKLPPRVRDACEETANALFLSVVSIWEIQIKRALGKLQLRGSLAALVTPHMADGITLLPVRLPHVLAIEDLPMIHKDPFDRLLVAQAKEEHLLLISADRMLTEYGIPLFW